MTRRLQGLNAWILQRVSAVYIAVFFVYFIAMLIVAPPPNFAAWKAWVSGPFVSLSFMLFFAFLLGHVWVGMRDVFMDYIPSLVLRAIILMLLAIGLALCGIWFARIMIVAMLT